MRSGISLSSIGGRRPTTTPARRRDRGLDRGAARSGRPRRHWASPDDVGHRCGLRTPVPSVSTFIDRGAAGDHGPLPGGRHLVQPLGRVRRVLLRALPGRLPRRRPVTTSRGARGPAGRRGSATLGSGGRSGSFALWRPLGLGSAPASTPTPCLIPNTGGGATEPPGHGDDRRAGADAGARDRQARHGLMAPWAIGMNAKEYRAAHGRASPWPASSASGSRSPTGWKDPCRGQTRSVSGPRTSSQAAMRPLALTKFAGMEPERPSIGSSSSSSPPGPRQPRRVRSRRTRRGRGPGGLVADRP